MPTTLPENCSASQASVTGPPITDAELASALLAQGLTAAEAQRRLAEYGCNELTTVRRGAGVQQFLGLFLNPLVLILIGASVVSAVLGDVVNAAIIVLIVLVSLTLDFVQTYRSQQAVNRLREGVAPSASVLRDGAWCDLPRREIVPGDLLRISAGDLVPADARLVTAKDLHVQQAALTGESLPVEKEVGDATSASSPSEARDRIFLGTSVISGTATATVIATGRSTAFGEIADRLTTRRPETEFERGTRRFGFLILQTVFFLVLFVMLVNITAHRGALESLLFAVALAVGMTPEFLPMITTVTLTQGAVHMARQHVVVKHLEALQNFGSMDILCSDKTGTLTSGEMTLDSCCDPFGAPSVRLALLAYLNSFYESGVQNPLDKAILARPVPEGAEAYRKLDEIPFDFDRRCISILVTSGAENLLITKGAPESVLAICSAYEAEGEKHPFDPETRARCEAFYRRLSGEGARVLALAYRSLPATLCRTDDERELVLLGYLAFTDPLLPDAAEALAALRRDGVEVKILTGDNDMAARHLCAQVGLDVEKIVLGTDLDRISDPALAALAEQASVFARVSPAQKNRILIALKRRRHVVGFLGDGINDTPSLHAADVGISVSSGTEVAKEAADIILMQPGLQVLHAGILEGRKAFGNVMKYLMMGTSSNFGNMFSMAGATLFLPFLPMLPTQILLNNFLYDFAQITIPSDNVDVSFIRKPRRWDIGVIRQFMLTIGPISSLYDFLTFFVLLHFFHATQSLFHTGWFVESLATQTLVLFIIRTAGNPFCSRPSLALTGTVLGVVFLGLLLPYMPLAAALHFTPLPAAYLLFLIGATVTYLGLVEIAKRRLMEKFSR